MLFLESIQIGGVPPVPPVPQIGSRSAPPHQMKITPNQVSGSKKSRPEFRPGSGQVKRSSARTAQTGCPEWEPRSEATSEARQKLDQESRPAPTPDRLLRGHWHINTHLVSPNPAPLATRISLTVSPMRHARCGKERWISASRRATLHSPPTCPFFVILSGASRHSFLPEIVPLRFPVGTRSRRIQSLSRKPRQAGHLETHPAPRRHHSGLYLPVASQ